ncbi:unnamed protein product [Mytilus coruscus]|uniref:Reverse transcriptase/retrotransposon-derived protein RNase H-like domain-containing protein n=1 Tax=Mytilus coruscus TaxID=42192 RepID=A0A6J8CQM3_MYTCO|nr:unnamed protein product [Mytilus coruscus]
MASALPVFPPFSVHESAADQRWKKWTKRLQNLLVGMNIKDKGQVVIYYVMISSLELQIIPQISRLSTGNKHELLCEQYKDIFHGLGKLKDTQVKIHIDNTVKPIVQPHIRIPFHTFKKQGVTWTWTSEQQQSFDALKQELMNNRIMAYFDPRKATVLIVDASPVGVGALFTQDGKVNDMQAKGA